MHLAADRGDPRIVNLLLDFEAEVDPKDNNRMTPLHYAALKGRFDTAKILLDNGAEINPKDKQGHTPLALTLALLENPAEMKGTTPHRLKKTAEILREYGGQQ
jgi:ankyrin repeat protein